MAQRRSTEAAALAASLAVPAVPSTLPQAIPTTSNAPVNTSIIPEANEIPTPEQLVNALKTEIFDADGNVYTFADLTKASPTVLVIFIRHFYCSACQLYVELLTKMFPPHLLYPATPLTISIIGCGPRELIPAYTHNLRTHLPHYTSPNLATQHALEIRNCEIKVGMRTNKYLANQSHTKLALKGAFQAIRWRIGEWYKPGGGGPVNQAGGEFVFVDGQCTWGHRMRTGGDHTDLDVLEEVLGKFGGEGGREARRGLRRDRFRGVELRTDDDAEARKSFDDRRSGSPASRKSGRSRRSGVASPPVSPRA
ncbi:hypothetical protein BJ508DRAFT_411999 [Ascobolus immersus RN42]|uniref:Thioredoxin-like protein n=1 Tax=Ascobolus immersus RN42 TaxID=1160509 RepID=A0A3N4IIZ6_ASCIM|nr:hypothetical protein BJ508DRAFT_411999 [Ascobolus immersus RN42]